MIFGYDWLKSLGLRCWQSVGAELRCTGVLQPLDICTDTAVASSTSSNIDRLSKNFAGTLIVKFLNDVVIKYAATSQPIYLHYFVKCSI